MSAGRWWACPAARPCDHGALAHLFDEESESHRCSSPGCPCGKPYATVTAERQAIDLGAGLLVGRARGRP